MPIMIAESVGAAGNITTAITTALEVCGTCVNFCLKDPVLCIGVGAGTKAAC